MSNQDFKTAITDELTRRGYTDIEIIGVSVEIRRATAYARTPYGKGVKLRIMMPENFTVYRRPHFRVTEID